MNTRVKKNGQTITIQINGSIDHDAQIPFRNGLNTLYDRSHRDSTPKRFIFDLSGLQFVGSTGLSAFVQTLKDFSQRTENNMAFCSAGSEFRKFIAAYDENQIFQFYENEAQAHDQLNPAIVNDSYPKMEIDH